MQSLDTPQAYRLIVLIGVFAVGLTGWLVYRSIVDVGTPIARRNNANSATNTSTAIAELSKLREKDTDSDKVSDYDELFSSNTSPYLKDSDSDGLDDFAELTKGTDPNCPVGKACSGTPVLTTPTDASGDLTPDFLRQALKQAGVAQSTLEALSDADLQRLYQSVLTENASTQNDNTNIPTTTSLEDLNNLTSAEIRKLLVESGVDASTLQAVDDATLRQIFLQGLNTTP